LSLHTDTILFEDIRQILWVLRSNASVERFNPYWTIYASLPQQMDALTWADVFRPDDRARLVEVRTWGVVEEKPYVVDARMCRVELKAQKSEQQKRLRAGSEPSGQKLR